LSHEVEEVKRRDGVLGVRERLAGAALIDDDGPRHDDLPHRHVLERKADPGHAGARNALPGQELEVGHALPVEISRATLRQRAPLVGGGPNRGV
jgi:hypothetical protein